MRSRLNDERGWALVTAMILMAIMMGTVLAVARYVDSQTKLGADSRKRETAFNMGEAALNGQIFALSQRVAGPGRCDDRRYLDLHAGVDRRALPERERAGQPDPVAGHQRGDVADADPRQRRLVAELLLRRDHAGPAGVRRQQRQAAVGARDVDRAGKTRTMVTLVASRSRRRTCRTPP